MKIDELHQRYDQEPPPGRSMVCTMLAKLGDKTIIDRVLADVDQVSQPDKV